MQLRFPEPFILQVSLYNSKKTTPKIIPVPVCFSFRHLYRAKKLDKFYEMNTGTNILS
jgi:hypothetical protein